MKIISIIFIVLAFAAGVSAQEKSSAKWTRIEFDNKNFAASFPPGFIVDAEKRDKGQLYRIFGYQNGVKMQLTVYKDGAAASRLKNLYFGEEKVAEFSSGNFKGKIVASEDFEKTFFRNMFLASDDHYYQLNVRADSGAKEEVKRFLYSINLGGKPLFTRKEISNLPEETVSLERLKTSPEISEAYARKVEKKEIKISYEASSPEIKDTFDEKLSRPPIVLEKPFPSFRPSSRDLMSYETYKVKLKVNFLANGQIGDIIAYSNSDKTFVKSCVDSARKIKFIPAQVDGKAVDAFMIVDYNMTVTTFPGVL